MLHGAGGFGKWLAQLARTDVLILDDWGTGNIDATTRNDLLEIIDDRAGYRATIIAHQVTIAETRGHDAETHGHVRRNAQQADPVGADPDQTPQWPQTGHSPKRRNRPSQARGMWRRPPSNWRWPEATVGWRCWNQGKRSP